MDKKQFSELMLKLEEIRRGVIDVENNTKPEKHENIDMVILKIRSAFFHLLEAKTGWGRNEIKSIFEASIETAINS